MKFRTLEFVHLPRDGNPIWMANTSFGRFFIWKTISGLFFYSNSKIDPTAHPVESPEAGYELAQHDYNEMMKEELSHVSH